ncbi:uncharacterized protein LOC106182103 isoform X3 [Lingula anatina]|uniref:Uncharacterized protein LOC106182103 isoform X3 n=1 Tax=Lingula anatina TaxID=7574 RepID=A0A1S3KIA0_LINAN|nr:uncharacterized protein LOC106182103 isoform X3 [Lingula anatina]|eukprot:XP_013422204.1 uncharacterized protein LOC106182103 isoform X3 [Lingula anatina]
MSSHAKYSIPLVCVGPSMRDGDWIETTVKYGVCSKNDVRLTLVLGPGVTWWKGLILSRKNDRKKYQVLIQLQDDQHSVTVTIGRHMLEQNHLVFCKAKIFGVKTNMYQIEDAATVLEGGAHYTFTWVKD